MLGKRNQIQKMKFKIPGYLNKLAHRHIARYQVLAFVYKRQVFLCLVFLDDYLQLNTFDASKHTSGGNVLQRTVSVGVYLGFVQK